MSEQTDKFAQRIGEVILKSMDLGIAMSRLNNGAAQKASKEVEAKPSKGSRKRKASKKPAAIAPNKAGPSQVAAPPAKKRYKGTAPLCNQCNCHHPDQTPYLKCTHCGRWGHLVNVCHFAIQDKAIANLAAAQPPARKPYVSTALMCNECNAPHRAYQQCRLCALYGRLGHLANACQFNPIQGGPNQPQVNPAQARLPSGTWYNYGETSYFRNK
ncbi:putative transcription factor interactor and regulator CCHC(Zn) family [Helianthus anomalus]